MVVGAIETLGCVDVLVVLNLGAWCGVSWTLDMLIFQRRYTSQFTMISWRFNCAHIHSRNTKWRRPEGKWEHMGAMVWHMPLNRKNIWVLVKTSSYHIQGSNHPLTSYGGTVSVPNVWLIGCHDSSAGDAEVPFAAAINACTNGQEWLPALLILSEVNSAPLTALSWQNYGWMMDKTYGKRHQYMLVSGESVQFIGFFWGQVSFGWRMVEIYVYGLYGLKAVRAQYYG